MTVSITSNLVLIDAADATTGWSGFAGINTDSLNNREGGTHLQAQASQESYEVFHTFTSEDYRDRTIFGWQLSGAPSVEADPAGLAMTFGDALRDVATAVIAAAGTGYTALDVLTVAGGTLADGKAAATIRVDTVDGGGGILTSTLLTGGGYAADAGTPNSVTGGTGSGATFTLTFAAIPNRIAYAVGGADNFGFTHLGWSNFRLNTAALPSNFRVVTGIEADVSPDIAVDAGYGGNFPGKAAGNADNVKFDAIRYCPNATKALDIAGGTTGARGTFQEIVTEDENTNNAYGIVRLMITGSKAYQCQFGLEIGDPGTADSFFDDADFQLFLNGSIADAGASISAGSMDFAFVGNATATTNLINYDNFLVVGLGAVSNWDASDVNIDELKWTNGQFVNLGTFLFQAQDVGSKVLTNIIWVNCGQVTFVGIDADNCTFNGSTNANGAILWDASSVEENQDDIRFNSDGTGHAIEIALNTASLTVFNIDGYTFDGFAGSTGTAGNRVFLIDNLLDGDVTINITNGQALNIQGGGDGFSFEAAAGYTGTVIINSTVTLSVTVTDDAANVLEDVFVSIRNASTNALVSEGRTNASGVYTDATFNYSGDVSVNIFTRKSSPGDTRYLPKTDPATIISTGLTVSVALAPDTAAGIIDATRFDISKHGQVTNDVAGSVITAKILLPGGTRRKLVVAGFYWDSTVNRTVTTFTYDGGAMTDTLGGNFVQEGSNFHEVFLYRHDIPDGDSGVKDVVLTLSGTANFRGIAFAVINLAATGAEEDDGNSVAQASTGNPTISLNNTTQPAISVMFSLTDDLDTFPPAASGVGSIRRADRAVDTEKQITIIRADRIVTGAHSIGCDYDAASKSYVSAAATFAD